MLETPVHDSITKWNLMDMHGNSNLYYFTENCSYCDNRLIKQWQTFDKYCVAQNDVVVCCALNN